MYAVKNFQRIIGKIKLTLELSTNKNNIYHFTKNHIKFQPNSYHRLLSIKPKKNP